MAHVDVQQQQQQQPQPPQLQASSSSAVPQLLALPGVLPFAPPAFPPTHLSGSLDLVSGLGLRTAYDAFVRPYFRNPKPLVVPLDGGGGGPGADVKGKGRATGEVDDGSAAGPAPPTGGEQQKQQQQQQQQQAAQGGKAKELDATVMDLKRFKDLDELVPECLVLSASHPAIRNPPTSLLRLVMDATDDMGHPLPKPPIRLRSALELQGKGWRLAPGDLPEAKDPGLFVRQPKPEKKKKRKRPLPPDQSIGTAPLSLNPLHVTLDPHKRHKASTPGATPRTPGLTPGGIGSSGPAGAARTPIGGGTQGKTPKGGSGKTPGV